MNYNDFTIDKLDEIPKIDWRGDDKQKYDSVVIVPTKEIHDSGYMCMAFLFCIKEEIIGKSMGCADVLNLDGIGGYGLKPTDIGALSCGLPKSTPIKAWSIDCLPNGYLRVFCRGKIKNGGGISNQEIFAEV